MPINTKMAAPQPKYLAAEDLAVWLKVLLPKANGTASTARISGEATEPPHSKVFIVDVRDQEEINSNGFIRSSVAITSDSFADDDDADVHVSQLLAMAEGTENPGFVFHCAFSQQRGPFCASRFLSRCSIQDKQPAVYILQGGFQNWKSLSRESELVSNFTMPAT